MKTLCVYTHIVHTLGVHKKLTERKGLGGRGWVEKQTNKQTTNELNGHKYYNNKALQKQEHQHK